MQNIFGEGGVGDKRKWRSVGSRKDICQFRKKLRKRSDIHGGLRIKILTGQSLQRGKRRLRTRREEGREQVLLSAGWRRIEQRSSCTEAR